MSTDIKIEEEELQYHQFYQNRPLNFPSAESFKNMDNIFEL
jgi:hypothetical protein